MNVIGNVLHKRLYGTYYKYIWMFPWLAETLSAYISPCRLGCFKSVTDILGIAKLRMLLQNNVGGTCFGDMFAHKEAGRGVKIAKSLQKKSLQLV